MSVHSVVTIVMTCQEHSALTLLAASLAPVMKALREMESLAQVSPTDLCKFDIMTFLRFERMLSGY